MKRTRVEQRNCRRGFTLTEVLLVLAIIGVIAAMVVPNLIGSQKKANIDATKVNIKGFETVLDNYAIANGGEYPTGSREDVINLLMNPGQDADGRQLPPAITSTPRDAWDQPLYYDMGKATPAGKPGVWSSGPNKVNDEGSGDDINNWTTR